MTLTSGFLPLPINFWKPVVLKSVPALPALATSLQTLGEPASTNLLNRRPIKQAETEFSKGSES